MDYLLYTNIVLNLVRDSTLSKKILKDFDILKTQNSTFISAVVIGEIKSISLQNKWKAKKKQRFQSFLNDFIVVDVNIESIIDRYAEIDAFSQGKLENRPLKNSSRNMGKNDLWIAATASVLNIPLITTDADFNHLNNEFLEVICVKDKFLPQS